MAGRSLRPRASVDYTASTNTSSTPKWLKNTRGLDVESVREEQPAPEGAKQSEKENKQPAQKQGKVQTQPAAKDEAEQEQGTVRSRQARRSAPAPAKLKAAKRGVGDTGSAAAAVESEVSEAEGDAAPTKKQLSRITKRHTEPVNKIQTSPARSAKRRDRPAEEAQEAEGEAPPKKKARTTKPKPGRAAEDMDPKAADTAGEQASQSRQPAPSQFSPHKTRSVSQSAADPGKDTADCSSNPAGQGMAVEAVSQQQKRPRNRGKQAAAEAPAVAAVAAEPAAVELNGAVGTATAARGHQGTAGTGPEAGNPLGTLPVSSNFSALQEEFAALHAKYMEVKSQRIQDVEEAITEIRAQEQVRSKKAMQLAAHWETEAQRQAAIAQHGDVAMLQKELEALQTESTTVKRLLLDEEAKVLEKEEEVAELKRRLGELIRLVETYQETLPEPLEEGLEPGNKHRQGDSRQIGTANGSRRAAISLAAARSSALPAASLRELTPASDPQALKGNSSIVPVQQSQRQQDEEHEELASAVLNLGFYGSSPASLRGSPSVGPRGAPSLLRGSPSVGAAAPVPHKREAAEGCPEGASRSQAYLPPAGLLAVGGPTGLVQCKSSAKPLVPYAVGGSVNQGTGMSRFATAHATSEAVAPIQNAASAEARPHESDALRGAPHAAQHLQSVANSQQGSHLARPASDSPAIERQLAFTPGIPVRAPAITAEAPPLERADAPTEQDMDVDNGSPQPAVEEHKDMPANGGHSMADGGEYVVNGGECVTDGGEHVTDGGEHVTNGGEHVTNGGDGMANGGRGTPSNVSHTAPISAISDITNKGMMNLVGLTINGARPEGGFSYTHPPTGFVFEIAAAEPDSEDEEGGLVFNPVDFGTAEPLLPPYLKYEIKFAPEMRLKLVSRIMEHLGRTTAFE